jgi:oligopeptide/dipeptide ABC transporter ATP-binding protein
MSNIGQNTKPILEVKELKKHYPLRREMLSKKKSYVYAVDGITFSINACETLGLVGESGCGKSTIGKTILRLIDPTDGIIEFQSVNINNLSRLELRKYRKEMQFVFQDPYFSVNPRMSIGSIVGEPLSNYKLARGQEKDDIVEATLNRVGLRSEYMEKFPHQMSGGQLQRVGIARALILNPRFIVCDEVVSALDVSVQAQVLNLLMDLQEEYKLSCLFITHDLAVVEHISHRIAVMYLGKIVELADRQTLFESPQHPYTQALLSAAPVPDPTARKERTLLRGDVPSPVNPPKGCRFNTRCQYAELLCQVEEPKLMEIAPNHMVACHMRHGS